MNNPILIDQAEEIDLIQPQVRAMLEAPGFYISGDSNNPEMNVPLVSNKRRVFSMKIDQELDPERFLPTLTLKGPYRVDPDANDQAREAGPDLLGGLQEIVKTSYDAGAVNIARAAIAPSEQAPAQPAAVAEPVAYRVLRKRHHDGEWITDGRPWCDGVPTQELVDDIALRSDGWRIEYAFAAPAIGAPVAQGDAEDAARWRFVTDLDNQEFAVCQWSEIECEWLLVAHPGDIDIAMAKEGGAA